MRVGRCTLLSYLMVATLMIPAGPAQSQVMKTPSEGGWNVVKGFAGNGIQGEVRSAAIGGGGLDGSHSLRAEHSRSACRNDPAN